MLGYGTAKHFYPPRYPKLGCWPGKKVQKLFGLALPEIDVGKLFGLATTAQIRISGRTVYGNVFPYFLPTVLPSVHPSFVRLVVR